MTNTAENRALEETSERLRRAQKAGRLGTWDWNVLTNELLWDGMEEVHGLPEGSFGGTLEAYLADIHPDDKERVLDAIAEARNSGSDLEVEYRIVLPDASVRWVAGRGTCFRDADGAVIRLSGTCQEITDRKRADLQKEDLFAFASHELRNPLTSILGFARLLERSLARTGEPLSEDAMEAIQTISSESQRMADIVETFLDLARTDSQHMELNLESIDLCEILEEETERLRRKYPHAEVALSAPDPLPSQTDVRRIRHIVSNLLDNAVKYGGEPPVVTVTARSQGSIIHVRVRDNGKGVSLQDRQHLFGRFYRGSAWSGGRSGLGIGLYLSRQFIERLGGSLELVSPAGQPAEFLVRVPLTRD